MRRSETRQRFRLAADAEGRLTGDRRTRRWSRNLPGESFSEPVDAGDALPLWRREPRHRARDRAGEPDLRRLGPRAGRGGRHARRWNARWTSWPRRRASIRSSCAGATSPSAIPRTACPFSSHTLARGAAIAARPSSAGTGAAPTPARVREGEWLIGMGMACGVRVNMLIAGRGARDAEPDGARHRRDRHDRHRHRHLRHPDQIAAEMLGLPMRARRDAARRHRPAARLRLRRLLGRVLDRHGRLPRLRGDPPPALPSGWAATRPS